MPLPISSLSSDPSSNPPTSSGSPISPTLNNTWSDPLPHTPKQSSSTPAAHTSHPLSSAPSSTDNSDEPKPLAPSPPETFRLPTHSLGLDSPAEPSSGNQLTGISSHQSDYVAAPASRSVASLPESVTRLNSPLVLQSSITTVIRDTDVKTIDLPFQTVGFTSGVQTTVDPSTASRKLPFSLAHRHVLLPRDFR